MNDELGSNQEEFREPLADSPSESENITDSTEDNLSDSDESSREDNNTPSGNQDEEDSEKPVGAKGLNRFQKLANEKRELSLREKEEQARRNPQGMPGGYLPTPAMPPAPYNPFAAQMAMTQRDLQIMKEEREFDQAARSFPELDQGSQDYDPDFHDMVWNIKRSEPGVSYGDAAKRVKNLLAKREAKIREKVETRIEEKSANSRQGGQTRTQPVGNSKTNSVKEAWAKFQATGKVEDYARYSALKKQNEGR